MLNCLIPLAVMVGFVGLFILIAIGFSYLSLVWMAGEMNKCPNCGRRAGGEIYESDVLDTNEYSEWREDKDLFGRVKDERRRIEVTETKFQDRYRCKHCGHEWTKVNEIKDKSPVQV
jgi:DNA-directed RNA polymerase subunit RPC12/RpoP